jgi:hypothetical protein
LEGGHGAVEGGKRVLEVGEGLGEVWNEGGQRMPLVVLLDEVYVLLGHLQSILQLLQRSFKLDFALGMDMEGVVSSQVHVVGVSKIFPLAGAIIVLAGSPRDQRKCTFASVDMTF